MLPVNPVPPPHLVPFRRYTEIVVDTSHFAIEAVIGRHNGGYGAQQSIKNTFGLSEAQLPLLDFGPGLKTRGPLFV